MSWPYLQYDYSMRYFSEEVHLRVQEHEDFWFGSFVSPQRVTSVTPAHLLVLCCFLGFWAVVLFWLILGELKLTSF